MNARVRVEACFAAATSGPHRVTPELGRHRRHSLCGLSRRPRVCDACERTTRAARLADITCSNSQPSSNQSIPRTLVEDGGSSLYGSELRRAKPGNEPEKCVLIGVDVTTRSKSGDRLFTIDDSMEELARLAETAGMQVVSTMTQALLAPYPGTYIGTGKVSEVRQEMTSLGCKTCIFDDELSPAQQRTLEHAFGGEAMGIKVIDRTALILDIFAQHAATREGQLQVELALYQYRLPRLTRMWTHLERQSGAGGVGLRGPGETQLETDRRIIGVRMAKLRKQIDGVRAHRTRQRKSRRKNAGLPLVALVGYTNAGKSTVLNALTGARVLAADALFATLDPTTRKAKVGGLKMSPEVLLTDTVGFVQNLPTQLVAAFRATLEEVVEADILVHVVDASVGWELMSAQVEAVENVLKQINASGKPSIVVLNKLDLVCDVEGAKEGTPSAVSSGDLCDEMLDLISRTEDLTGYDCVAISAREMRGVEEVGALLEEALSKVMLPVEAVVPYSRGDLVSALHEQGVCEFEHFVADGTHVVGRAPHALSLRLAPYAIIDEDADNQHNGAGVEDEEEIDWVALAKKRH